MRLILLLALAGPAAACPFHDGFGFGAHGWGEPSVHFAQEWGLAAPPVDAPAPPVVTREQAVEQQRVRMLELYPALRAAETANPSLD